MEKRGSFDVHLYGSRIINSFPEQNNSISFSRIVGGQPREEVRGPRARPCYLSSSTGEITMVARVLTLFLIILLQVARFFLSSLMLANTLNVDVGTDPGTDPFLGQVRTE